MAQVSLAVLISSSIILSFISLLSLCVIYQLYLNLCCCNRGSNDTKLVYSNSDATSTSSPSSTPTSVKSPGSTANGTDIAADIKIATDIHRNVQRNQKPEISSFLRNTTLTASTMFFIVSIIINIDRILSTQNYWIQLVIIIFYFIAKTVLTLIFITRLYHTFNGSPFEYSKCTIISLKCIWFLMLFFCILSASTYSISSFLMLIFSVLFILIDIILSCVLLYLYVQKVSILKNNDKTNTMLISEMNSYTLLYSMCVISTFIVFILIIIMYFVTDDIMDLNKSNEGFRSISIFISIHSLFNLLCLWLSLSFAKLWYFRLCGQCHKKCYGPTQDEEMLTNVQNNTDIIDNNKADCDTFTNMTILTVESDMFGNKAIIL